jgi:tRNA(Ile)-lysidine synthase
MVRHAAAEPAVPELPVPAGLLRACPEFASARRVIVGFSGGLDSTVLLHLLEQAYATGLLRGSLLALHVNHALQPAADSWQEHCRDLSARFGIAFEAVRAPVTLTPGASPEDCARDARYGVFVERLQHGDVLALAHHRDDQAETVLFRLLRGSGAGGLAGMPRMRACGAGVLLRPLLDYDRAALLAHAQSFRLNWIDDASNLDRRYDRNCLRHDVLPLLRQRWPGLNTALARSAQLSGEAAALLDTLARIDLVAAAGPRGEQLRCDVLSTFDAARQRNLLRYWLETLHASHGFALPNHHVLHAVVAEVLPAAVDAEPLVAWGEGAARVELRRHRGLLHVCAPLPEMAMQLCWHTGEPLQLPAPLGWLTLEPAASGLPRARLGDLRIAFRQGGEQVTVAGRQSRPLKKILQDAGVPPWLRDRIPMLYAGDELVAVADLLVCEGWLTRDAQDACRIVWAHPDLDCGYQPHLLI